MVMQKKYHINIIEIQAEYAEEKTERVKLTFGGNLLNVEDYVRKLFENQGYTVLNGADLHLFLWFCCGKFDNVTGGNWGDASFIELNHQNREKCSGHIHDQWGILVRNATQMWVHYYQSYPLKAKLASLLSDSINIFDQKEIVALLNVYASAEYDPRGAPDLFVFNKETKDRQFVEVKSYTDSLRYEQLRLASELTNEVGSYFSIAYVLPVNYDELMCKKTLLASLDLAAKHLQKLYAMGSSKVCGGFDKASNKVQYATNECGVNLNSIIFFVNKIRKSNLPYDSANLDFGGKFFSLDQYLNRLEQEWNRLTLHSKI